MFPEPIHIETHVADTPEILTILNSLLAPERIMKPLMYSRETLMYARTGTQLRHLWVVYRITRSDAAQIDVIRGHRIMLGTNGVSGWVYQTELEEAGPDMVDCPLEFLERTFPPVPGSPAAAWRERVITFHEYGIELPKETP